MGIFATYSAEVYGISFVSEKMIRIARFWTARIYHLRLSFVFQCVVIFSFSALTLLVGGLQQDRLACEKLGVGLFVVTI